MKGENVTMIQIKNLRSEKPQNPWDVKVDRSSVLGNPFPMKNETERNKICEEYTDYFNAIIARINGDMLSIDLGMASPFESKLNRLLSLYKEHGQLNLFCWCASKRCHAEVIRHYLYKVINPDTNPYYDMPAGEKDLEQPPY
jgi:hypothetical protein